VGGQIVSASVPTSATGNLTTLAASLNTSLQSKGLLVSTINNGSDLQISDSKGRDISGVALTPASTADGASVGQIGVTAAAVQVANWINGTSQANVVNPFFGAGGNPGFSQFKATVGGVNFSLDVSAATDLSSLARNLQQAFRAKDKGSDISVVVDGTNLKIVDARGRAFKDFSLIPADSTSLASGGTVTIDNSNVSKTNIRAEVFSEIRIPVAQLNLSKELKLNGQTISGYKTANELVDRINASMAGVSASIEANGELVISDPLGSPITVNATTDGNALDIQPTSYGGQVRMVQVLRDMRVAATEVDLKKPLEINGLNLSESAYDLPASNSQIIRSNSVLHCNRYRLQHLEL